MLLSISFALGSLKLWNLNSIIYNVILPVRLSLYHNASVVFGRFPSKSSQFQHISSSEYILKSLLIKEFPDLSLEISVISL